MSEARQPAAAEILVNLVDGIGSITLNRPETRNPLSLGFAEAMNAALALVSMAELVRRSDR